MYVSVCKYFKQYFTSELHFAEILHYNLGTKASDFGRKQILRSREGRNFDTIIKRYEKRVKIQQLNGVRQIIVYLILGTNRKPQIGSCIAPLDFTWMALKAQRLVRSILKTKKPR